MHLSPLAPQARWERWERTDSNFDCRCCCRSIGTKLWFGPAGRKKRGGGRGSGKERNE